MYRHIAVMQQRPRQGDAAPGGGRTSAGPLPAGPPAADPVSEITPLMAPPAGAEEVPPPSYLQRASAAGLAAAPAGPGFGSRPTGALYTSSAPPGPGGARRARCCVLLLAAAVSRLELVQAACVGVSVALTRGCWRPVSLRAAQRPAPAHPAPGPLP